MSLKIKAKNGLLMRVGVTGTHEQRLVLAGNGRSLSKRQFHSGRNFF